MTCIRIRSKKETAMVVFWEIYPFCPCLFALLATLKVVHDPSTSSHQRSSQALGTRLQLLLCVPGQQLQQPWPKQTLTRIAIEMIEMDMKKDVKTEMRMKRMNLTEEIMEVEVLEALEAWEALQVLEAKGGRESVQKRRLRDCHQLEKRRWKWTKCRMEAFQAMYKTARLCWAVNESGRTLAVIVFLDLFSWTSFQTSTLLYFCKLLYRQYYRQYIIM